MAAKKPNPAPAPVAEEAPILSPPVTGRQRLYKGIDGDALSFTESKNGSGWDVFARAVDGSSVKMWISKGEARSFGRFFQIRPKRR